MCLFGGVGHIRLLSSVLGKYRFCLEIFLDVACGFWYIID
jgi:hypothetical protein